MNDFLPLNDLDRAIMAMQKSKAATPDFYRQLAEGELWLPVNYHPELEDGGGFSIGNGSPIPFALLEDKTGKTYVPLFSSDARYDEGLQKAQIPENTYLAAAIPAKQILEILGKSNLWAEVNKGCATGSMLIGPDLMRDLASGVALQPSAATGDEMEAAMKIVDPADYPTEMLQPVFELLRQRPQFRVAWLFTDLPENVQPDQPRRYYFVTVMDPWDEVIFHDFNMVVAAACGSKYLFELIPTTAADKAAITTLFETGAPYYTATGYRKPRTKKT